MEIKVLGPGCAKCSKTEKIVRDTVSEMGIDARVEKITDILRIAEFGVLGTPAVVLDGQVMCSGKVPSKDQVKSWLAK